MAGEASTPGEVAFAGGASASTLFHRVVASAISAHPAAFAQLSVPASPDGFKRVYGDWLPAFEAARADAGERGEIAATLVRVAGSQLTWRTESGESPLAEHVAAPAEPLPLETATLGDGGGLYPGVPCGGRSLRGAELEAFALDLVTRGSASPAVADAVSSMVRIAGGDGIDLRGRRIAVLGAAAELAPVTLWLSGGAHLLWIDVTPPPAELLEAAQRAGTVSWVPGGADILRAPARIRATLEAFAPAGGVDVALYAYAPGRGREWRLTGAMNAIVDALDAPSVRTITMLVSPTTPGLLTPAELDGERKRHDERPRWQAALQRTGALGRGGGHIRHGATCANRGIVPIQGAGYQAAQYLGKMMAAEAWVSGDPPRHVSANVAGISRTVSLRHPVFDTAFGGAAAFGVETFEPGTTASLNGLLALWDWLDPASPSHPGFDHESPRDRAGALATTRVHGGIYQLPYPIEPTLRVATALGVARDPRRIGALLQRR